MLSVPPDKNTPSTTNRLKFSENHFAAEKAFEYKVAAEDRKVAEEDRRVEGEDRGWKVEVEGEKRKRLVIFLQKLLASEGISGLLKSGYKKQDVALAVIGFWGKQLGLEKLLEHKFTLEELVNFGYCDGYFESTLAVALRHSNEKVIIQLLLEQELCHREELEKGFSYSPTKKIKIEEKGTNPQSVLTVALQKLEKTIKIKKLSNESFYKEVNEIYCTSPEKIKTEENGTKHSFTGFLSYATATISQVGGGLKTHFSSFFPSPEKGSTTKRSFVIPRDQRPYYCYKDYKSCKDRQRSSEKSILEAYQFYKETRDVFSDHLENTLQDAAEEDFPSIQRSGNEVETIVRKVAGQENLTQFYCTFRMHFRDAYLACEEICEMLTRADYPPDISAEKFSADLKSVAIKNSYFKGFIDMFEKGFKQHVEKGAKEWLNIMQIVEHTLENFRGIDELVQQAFALKIIEKDFLAIEEGAKLEELAKKRCYKLCELLIEVTTDPLTEVNTLLNRLFSDPDEQLKPQEPFSGKVLPVPETPLSSYAFLKKPLSAPHSASVVPDSTRARTPPASSGRFTFQYPDESPTPITPQKKDSPSSDATKIRTGQYRSPLFKLRFE